MDLSPFFIEYSYNQSVQIAEIKPCCHEENVFYYDVYIKNQYCFTIRPEQTSDIEEGWKIALKNADTPVDEDMVNLIGQQIDLHYYV